MDVVLAHPIYLAFDTSGSTANDGWIEQCNQALPAVVDALEGRPDNQPSLLSILGWATEAQLLLHLSTVAGIMALPQLRPLGFSSLASAFRLLRAQLDSDMAQLAGDGIVVRRPTTIVVMRGLPTDRVNDLLASRDALVADREFPAPCLHLISDADTDLLALRGLTPGRVGLVPSEGRFRALPASIVDALTCDREHCRRASGPPVTSMTTT